MSAMSAGPSPLIRLRGIEKIYGQGQAAFHALRGIDLDIDEGDFIAVMGPSGSGKSTVMNILGCLDVPSAGQYLFRGVHVERFDRDQRARLRRQWVDWNAGFLQITDEVFTHGVTPDVQADRYVPERPTRAL